METYFSRATQSLTITSLDEDPQFKLHCGLPSSNPSRERLALLSTRDDNSGWIFIVSSVVVARDTHMYNERAYGAAQKFILTQNHNSAPGHRYRDLCGGGPRRRFTDSNWSTPPQKTTLCVCGCLSVGVVSIEDWWLSMASKSKKSDSKERHRLPPDQQRELEKDGRCRRLFCDILRLRVLAYIVSQPTPFTFILSLFLIAITLPLVGLYISRTGGLPDLDAMQVSSTCLLKLIWHRVRKICACL